MDEIRLVLVETWPTSANEEDNLILRPMVWNTHNLSHFNWATLQLLEIGELQMPNLEKIESLKAKIGYFRPT